MIRIRSALPIAILAVAACSGGRGAAPGIPISSNDIKAVRAHSWTPACRGAQRGRAQCGAIIRGTAVEPGTIAGWSPSQLEAAYNLPSADKGSGQIVAVVDAYDNPNVASDLATYRSTFGLPAAKFAKYNQYGQMSHYPKGDTGWGVQIDQDVEMVSASCPKCTIYLIEASSNDGSDLQSAEAEATKLGSQIVSNSWVCYSSESCVSKSYFDTAGVTYLGMSGDNGYDQLGAPAVFDSVVAVGGTVLSQGGGSRGWTDTVWPYAGGGCSSQPKPPWQTDNKCAYRLADDVSAVAENVAEYDSYGYSGWFTVAGTNVATGFLAGVFGLAGNAGKQDGGRTFWRKAHHQYLYEVVKGGKSVRYSEGAGWGTPDGIGAF